MYDCFSINISNFNCESGLKVEGGSGLDVLTVHMWFVDQHTRGIYCHPWPVLAVVGKRRR